MQGSLRHVFFVLIGLFAHNHSFIFSMEAVVAPNSRQATSGGAASCDEVGQVLARMSLGAQQANQNRQSYAGILFFDWDNTICPASELCLHTSTRCEVPFVLLPEELRSGLTQIDNIVKQIIVNIRAAGFFTCIVTKAETSWILLSSRAYLPNMRNLIDTGLLPVFSAYSVPAGKKAIFSEQIERIQRYRDQRRDFSVIAFGDDEADRLGFLQACSGVPRVFVKSIKLVSKPKASQVSRQLAFLLAKMTCIVSAKQNLDLMLEISNEAPRSS